PVEIERVLISTQHRDGLDAETLIKPDLIERVLHPILPPNLYDEGRLQDRDFVLVNPTGKFVVGGPMGDSGLTGRKIIVDTYGGRRSARPTARISTAARAWASPDRGRRVAVARPRAASPTGRGSRRAGGGSRARPPDCPRGRLSNGDLAAVRPRGAEERGAA